MSSKKEYYHEGKEQLKKSKYFSELHTYKFQFYTEGEIFYKYVDTFGDYEIQISFRTENLFSCHAEHEFEFFDSSITEGFEYTICKIEKTVTEEY